MKKSKQTSLPKYKDTLVVNLLAGPGAGKSTTAASLFASLKWAGVDCELAAEYAKDLVWEQRYKTFENQVYLFGKQHHRIFRLLGQVRVVITDSPIWLTPIYDAEKRESLKQLVFNEARKCNNLNVFLIRKKKYNPNGRNHTKKQAGNIDKVIEKFLSTNKISHIREEGTPQGVENLSKLIINLLNKNENS